MAKINEAERKTQDRAVAMFRDKATLGYEYYGDLHHQSNGNVITEKLMAFLVNKQKYSVPLSVKAVDTLLRAAGNLQQGLYKANQEVYSLLKYGEKVKENPGEPEKNVYFIDWEHPHNNEFAIAEEVTIKLGNERRPDLVVYINGIAVVVIELKKSTVSVSHGIRQNISNQNEHFSKSFFTTVQ